MKYIEPKADPRLVGRVLSAMRLKSKGCTTPRPTPFSNLPANIISNDVAKAQTICPAAQEIMPAATSKGRGNNSCKKPHGKPQSAAATPFADDMPLSAVWEAPKVTWKWWKNVGKMLASTVHAMLHRHMSTYSPHTRWLERDSDQPASGSTQGLRHGLTISPLALLSAAVAIAVAGAK